MGTFGDRLKRERELRGVTLEEIAEATKIGTRSLKALEDEQFDQLPGGIFNKGFVKAYAKFLGLDEEQAVSDFMVAQGELPASAAKSDVMTKLAAQAEMSRKSDLASSGGEKTGKSNTIWITAAILVLVTAGVAAGIRYRKMKQEAAQASTPKPVVQQQVQAPPPTMPPTSADATLPVATPGTATDPNASATQPATQTSTGTTTTQPAATPAGTATAPSTSNFPNTVVKPPASASPATATPVNATSSGKAALELQIHVSRATWLSIQADGKEPTNETLRDSATKTVIAQDRVVITSGNAVDVTCNGKSLGILGADNKRSQVRITADCKVN